MDNEKFRFRHESLQDSKSVQGLLQAVTDGLVSGKLNFSDESGEIEMSPKGLLHLKLRASREDGRNSLRLSVQWQDGSAKAPVKKTLKVNKKRSSNGRG